MPPPREGARVGSVGSDEAGVTDAVNNALNNINLANTPVITITPQNGTQIPCDETLNPQPDSVTVNVQVAAQLDIPFVAGQSVNLTGEGTFRCEYLS